MDDAPTLEAVSLQGAAHGPIVLMGVRPDVADPALAEIVAGLSHAPVFPAGGQPVDGAVGAGGAPAALLNLLIGGVLPQDKGEYAGQLPVRLADVALALPDVLRQQVPTGIAVDPLDIVALARMKALPLS